MRRRRTPTWISGEGGLPEGGDTGRAARAANRTGRKADTARSTGWIEPDKPPIESTGL